MNRGRHKKSKEKKDSILKQKSQTLYKKSFIDYQQYVKIDQHIVYMIIMQLRGLVVMMEEAIIVQLDGILIVRIILIILQVELKQNLIEQLLKIKSI